MILYTRIQRTAFFCLVTFIVARSTLASARNEERASPEFVTTTLSTRRDNRDKVKVELYYMPQCPGCRQLITTSFEEAFKTPGFSDMADVTFVPYGTARENHNAATTTTTGSSGSQSQQNRVFDNVLESCALHTIGNHHQDQQFAYIGCIDHNSSFEQDPFQIDRACTRAIGLSTRLVGDIEACAASHEGHVLAERNVQQSESIDLRYFPWIVVDRSHTPAIESAVWESLFDYVCGVYSGSHRSQECPDDNMFGGGDDDLLSEQL